MATTTNFGWTTPDDTALVKDGAAAIRTLGSSIDTSFVDLKGGTTGQLLKKTSNTDLDFEWGTASSGLTLINTTSFSAVASQSVNSVFTATYTHYKILLRLTAATADAGITLKLRKAGTDTSANYYMGGWQVGYTGTTTDRGTNNGSSFPIGNIDTSNPTNANAYDINFYSPNTATSTNMTGISHGQGTDGVGFFTSFAGVNLATTGFDGFTVIASAGNITGKVSVYGFSE